MRFLFAFPAALLSLLVFLAAAGCGGEGEKEKADGAAVHSDSIAAPDSAAAVQEEKEEGGDSVTVTLFMVETGNDSRDSGKGMPIGCGDLLVERRVRIPKGDNLLAGTMRALIAPENDGPENFVAGKDVKLERAEISGGIARVYLAGVIPLSGVCDHPRVEQQLLRTAAQFAEADSAIVYIGGQRLEEYLSLR